MTRKLLPYEHQLVEALGITKEEYLEFVALQKQYEDPKTGTNLDIQNATGTVALVLTIVGILFQVAAALLTPRPRVPSQRGQAQTREQRVAPRSGFNTIQELATYDDAIPLVYTNTAHNPDGGVRIAASLLWSAVRSLGNRQFVQMLMMLSAGAIQEINATKSAFGQTPVLDLVTTDYWIYFEGSGTRRFQYADAKVNDPKDDPTYSTSVSSFPYKVQSNLASTSSYEEGFSHAYTPSSSNVFGVYSPVPINVNMYSRDEDGNKKYADLGITISGLSGDGLSSSAEWGTGLNKFDPGEEFKVIIKDTKTVPDNNIRLNAYEARRTYASVFNEAGLYKLGSGKFQLVDVNGDSSDFGKVEVSFKGVDRAEPGFSPNCPYKSKDDSLIEFINRRLTDPNYLNAKKIADDLLLEDGRDAAPDSGGYNSTYTRTKGYKQITTYAELLQSGQVWRPKYQTRSIFRQGVITGSTNVFDGWSKRKLTTSEKASLRTVIELERELNINRPDNVFFTKALVRFDTAKYRTIQACHSVDLSIKANVFRRISGRASVYGGKQRKGWKESDNGMKFRSALFLLRYTDKEGAAPDWKYAPGIFVISRNNEADNYVNIRFNSNQTTAKHWRFELEPISDPVAEAKLHSELRSDGKIQYFYLRNTASKKYVETVGLPGSPTLQFYGNRSTSNTGYPANTGSPKQTNEWDLFSNDADTQYQLSCDSAPEMTLIGVTEHIFLKGQYSDLAANPSAAKKALAPSIYSDMSLIGFSSYSSNGLQDVRSFTAFVTKGRLVRRLYATKSQDPNYPYYPKDRDGASSYAPDIFLDTVLDSNDGIGKYAPVNAVDLEGLRKAKRFCRANNLFFDGVIADRTSWREFWATVAPYSLLEFGRQNGKETLLPAVPYDSQYKITTSIKINGLFNQGNILEDSYKEEFIDYGSNVQDLIASVIYRSLDDNGIFAINKSVEVKLKDADSDAIRETFDLSAYVTTRAQAILYGKLLCNLRRHVKSAIEFKTYPTTSPLAPGAFIYVDVGQNAWDGVRSGVISAGGVLNMPITNTVADGSYTLLMYKSGSGIVSLPCTVSNNAVQNLDPKYTGYLFVLGTKVSQRRVFRVTEVEMDEEGEVTVRATAYPCKQDGSALIPDFSSSLFTVQG